jgi:hypothetical protein
MKSARFGGICALALGAVLVLSACGGSSSSSSSSRTAHFPPPPTPTPRPTTYFPPTPTPTPSAKIRLDFPELWAADGCLASYVFVNGKFATSSPLSLCRAADVDNPGGFVYFNRGQTADQWFEAAFDKSGFSYWEFRTDKVWHRCAQPGCTHEEVKAAGGYLPLDTYLRQTTSPTGSELVDLLHTVVAQAEQRNRDMEAEIKALEAQQAADQQAAQQRAALQAQQVQVQAAQQAAQRAQRPGVSRAEAYAVMSQWHLNMTGIMIAPACLTYAFGCGPH